ncbi:hypothetical protein JG687_00006808 [Phytophthora cactorum]|uniref:Protein kinase domain-containing protein n=1 Tax=Phytophthora cactorum TaxID=29920 RepID=A0A8T1UGV9_9STRA|nr:hypothetical protein PC120_g12799 [Phytophthora cactorum]KAG3064347.1 hypothetical protein PC121_g11757 [Phytophthora cactorum]KAG4056932.1 hypothetical protein PC123_g8039 [Phytophthora cactorum]KAG6963008.1 hypothetical protein JG687_00006808 [Phytophthora cactorum]
MLTKILRHINDPEHPLTLEQLKVMSLENIHVDDANSRVKIYFTPTIPHCSMATLIGLCLRVKLRRSLPPRFKSEIPHPDAEEYINLRSRKGELETLVEEMKASSEAATMSESSFVADSPSHAVSPVRRPSPTGRTSAAGFRALLPDEYVLECVAGKGTTSTCYKCMRRTDGRRFACKIIEKRKLALSARKRMEVAAQLRREVEVLRRVDHPHIAKLEQSFEDDNYLTLVMERSR